MRIPESVKIGGYMVTVRECEGLYSDHEAIGQFVPRLQEIQMDPGLTQQQAEEVFIHEVLEAVNYFYKLGLKHSYIATLGVLLHQVIKDNPGVFAEDVTVTGAGKPGEDEHGRGYQERPAGS